MAVRMSFLQTIFNLARLQGNAQEMLTIATVYASCLRQDHYIETPEESSSTYDDYSIRIAVSKDERIIFGHIMMDAEVLQRLHVGDMVEAGEILGTFGPVSKLDLYVLDRARGNSLDNDTYPMTMPYAQNPFSYFPDELREQLYDKLLPPKPAGSHDDAMAVLQRHDPTLDGCHSSSYLSLIDDSTQSTEEVFRTHYLDLRSTFPSIEGTFTYDIANCLQGNWFVPLSEGRWDEGISFHYDHWYPSQPRIRVSQPFPTVGEIRGFALLPSQDGFIPFADAAVGEEVVYVLYDTSFCNWHGVPYEDPLDVGNENPIGLLLVKIERSDMIKVEAFAYNSSLHADFTSHARYYYANNTNTSLSFYPYKAKYGILAQYAFKGAFMAYEVTATRKRPQVFDNLVGQEFVVSTIKHAIEQGRIAHAYLFSGPRGVGKTSSARILARALNCEQGPSANPCGVCSNCREITQGNNVDVIEIDGASNTA